ncbi:MAG TPA: hypothetical protein VG125_19720, partial [Pirellulales bacterium]|nr:hypothetical protein [Pirellulales bacterium]
MPTTVQYGSIIMQGVLTLQWDQDVIYDDSHTDQVRNNYRLAFQGLVHAQGSITGGGVPSYMYRQMQLSASSAADRYNQIKACLLEPR